MEFQIWLNGPAIQSYEPPSPSHSPSLSNNDLPTLASANPNASAGANSTNNNNSNSKSTPSQWLHGPFLYFDPKTFTRSSMPEEATVNSAAIEWSMPSLPADKAELGQAQGQGQAQAQQTR
jgi:hypothetical protein